MTVLRSTLAIGLVALLGSTAAASAADLIVDEVMAEPVVSASYDWSGFYVGLFGGWGGGSQDSAVFYDTVSDPDGTIGDLSEGFDVSGGLVGLAAGYNADMGGFVLGLEGDVAWTNISGSVGRTALDDMGNGDPSDDVVRTNVLSSDYSWLSTFRGRIGVAAGQVLFFGTAGLAAGTVTDGLTYSDDQSPDEYVLDETSTLFGWTAGAGIELAVADNATLKVEYQYVDLGDTTVQTGNYWGSDASEFTVSHNLHIAKAGVNWKF